MALKTLEDRRRAPRLDLQTRVEIGLSSRQARLTARSVNLSEGGICVRLREALEVRSRVRLLVFPSPSKRPLQCAGRVSWVVQRLDLRDAPPFLYDVGLEFVDPTPRLREWVSRSGIVLKPSLQPLMANHLRPVTVRGRDYLPQLEKAASPATPWHLIVCVDGIPCFSRRYSSQREAMQSWEQFKRRLGRSLTTEVIR